MNIRQATNIACAGLWLALLMRVGLSFFQLFDYLGPESGIPLSFLLQFGVGLAADILMFAVLLVFFHAMRAGQKRAE